MTPDQAFNNIANFLNDYAAALRQLGQPSMAMLMLENAKGCLDTLRPAPAPTPAQDHA